MLMKQLRTYFKVTVKHLCGQIHLPFRSQNSVLDLLACCSQTAVKLCVYVDAHSNPCQAKNAVPSPFYHMRLLYAW